MLTVRLETLGLAAGDWVLDLGCGEGRHVHGVHMIPGVNVVGLDLDIASLVQTLKLYRLDNQRYPSTEQGLQALVTKPTTSPIPSNWKTGGYVERLPRDPWGNLYQFLNPGVRGEVDVFSLGADGAPGGEGLDADIGSWAQ